MDVLATCLCWSVVRRWPGDHVDRRPPHPLYKREGGGGVRGVLVSGVGCGVVCVKCNWG